jgi:MFS family permease
MLGAVAGPLAASLLIWAGMEFRTIIFWTLVPGLLAAGSMFLLTGERERAAGDTPADRARPPFPRSFWVFLVGAFLFGLGDFSRTFLIWLAAQGLGSTEAVTAGAAPSAVFLYTVHNLVSAGVAYPIGHWGDRISKLHVLLWGYGLGVATNVLLALFSGSFAWLVGVVVLSGAYIAVEETLEKAVAAEMLPQALRSLGFGLLACANAVGDMGSSVYVGLLLDARLPVWAFGLAAALGASGVLWLLGMRKFVTVIYKSV